MLWMGGAQQGVQERAGIGLCFFTQKQRGLHSQWPFSDWGTKADNFLPFISTPNQQSLILEGRQPGAQEGQQPWWASLSMQ